MGVPVESVITQLRPAPQAFPQLPQCVGSICGFTHIPPHEVVPRAHTELHAPAEQDSVAEHARPHIPQLLVST